MQVLYFFETLRHPVLDKLMLGITQLGGEKVFLLISLLTFWCVDKRRGYYLMSVGFLGTVCNQFFKLLFRIPRPWVLDPEFTIVEQARAGAGGYSFPSGHTQSAVGLFGALCLSCRRRSLQVICATAALLVPISRMYLGVHTPLDVSVSFLIAVGLIFLLRPVAEGRSMSWITLWLPLLSGLFLIYTLCFPPAADPAELAHSIHNAANLFGAALGVSFVYFLDARYLRFSVEAPLPLQAAKGILGIGAVLALRAVLRLLLDLLMPGHWASAVILNFLVVLAAGVAWPYVFTRFFPRRGENNK